MLKITHNDISLIVPQHWMSYNGFLTHVAVCAIKLFFGEYTLEKALKESKKRVGYSWYSCGATKYGMEGGNDEEVS